MGSATLTLAYPAEELVGLDENAVRVGRWLPDTRSWELLTTTVDPVAHTAEAQVLAEGTYAAVLPLTLTCPAAPTLTVGADQVALSWSAAPEGDGVQDGAEIGAGTDPRTP